jgi:hypothetical protein
MFTRTGYKLAQQAKFTTSDAITGDRLRRCGIRQNGKALVGSFAQYNNMEQPISTAKCSRLP